ncbi:MAG: cellulose synthase family protein [Sediminibacterium sp.]
MKTLFLIIFIVYCLITVFIFLYTLMQLHLTAAYIRYKKKKKQNTTTVYNELIIPDKIVTIQLPMFNEPFVAERLIDAVCNIEYPKHLLEIQVLDDSTDKTVDIVDMAVARWQKKGIDIKAIRRTERSGFKAGALKFGLSIAKGEYIAIFDADFVPSKDFLQKTVPALSSPEIGMVQTRWGHINRHYSLLTQTQAFWLENHFRIEQTSRSNLGLFFNFNGTAGVWKKQAILDGGNWQSDTLTEDLDLSYRSLLSGWKFVYLEDIVSPAELPPTVNAFKSQQYRWTKGGAEVSKKLLLKLFKAKIPLTVKIHAIGHLLNSFVYLSVSLAALLSIPLLFIKDFSPSLYATFTILSVFFLNLIILTISYYTATKEYFIGSNFFSFLKSFHLHLSLSSAMSFFNSNAVLHGFFGKKTPFVRTPKYNTEATGNIALRFFSQKTLSKDFPITLLLFLVFFTAAIYGIFSANWSFLLFHITLAIGFFMLLTQHNKKTKDC